MERLSGVPWSALVAQSGNQFPGWFLWITPVVVLFVGMWGASLLIEAFRRLHFETGALVELECGQLAEALAEIAKGVGQEESLVKQSASRLLCEMRASSTIVDVEHLVDDAAANLDERVATPRAIGASAVLVGLAGTILGLTATVLQLRSAMEGGGKAVTSAAVSQLIDDLMGVFEHSGMAFVSAGAGVLVSVVLSSWIAAYAKRSHEFESRLMRFLVVRLIPVAESVVGVPSQNDLLRGLQSTFEKFGKTLPEFSEHLAASTVLLKGSVDTLSRTQSKVERACGALLSTSEALNDTLVSVHNEVGKLAEVSGRIAGFHTQWGEKSEQMFVNLADIGRSLVENQALLADAADRIQKAAHESLSGVRDVVSANGVEQREILTGFRDALRAHQVYAEEVLRTITEIPHGVAAGRLIVTDKGAFERLHAALELLTAEVRSHPQTLPHAQTSNLSTFGHFGAEADEGASQANSGAQKPGRSSPNVEEPHSRGGSDVGATGKHSTHSVDMPRYAADSSGDGLVGTMGQALRRLWGRFRKR